MSQIRLSAQRAGEEVAFVQAQQVLDELEIIHIEVEPAFRRQGEAERLLTRLIAQQRARRVFLEVRVTNAAAIALYRKMGFVQIAIRHGYYRSPREDAAVMKLEL